MSGRHFGDGIFHWADYMVFSLVLLFSASIGLYYGIQDRRRKQGTLDHFVLAGRKMNILPVSVSLFVSWTSALSFLGDPVDVYYNGAIYVFLPLGYLIILPFVACFFAPTFNKMNIYSAYEFIGRRYNPPLRVLVSVIVGLSGGIYCGIVLYGPAIALSQASGLANWVAVVIVGFVCIFYTTMGGMKAVLWTDTFQIFIMFAGFLALLVRGCMVVGGVGAVWRVAEERGRINILNFNPSPFVRSTFWTYLFGGMFRLLTSYTTEQAFVQRYCALKDGRSAKIAVLLNIPLFLVFGFMFTLLGLVMVAYFDGCDPMTTGRIQRKDQMVPLLMMDLLGFIPGFSGLILGSVFAASLSTLSTYMNSLSLTLLKDIVEPLYAKCNRKPMSTRMSLGLTKLFCVLLGVTFIALGIIIDQIRNASIFEMSLSILGLIAGPICALFVLGIHVRFVKFKGALTGMVVAFAISIWWYVGSLMTADLGTSTALSVDVTNCTFNTSHYVNYTVKDYATSTIMAGAESTVVPGTTPAQSADVSSGVEYVYRLSPLLYNALGFCVTSALAVTIGLVHGLLFRKKPNASPSDTKNGKEAGQDASAIMLAES